MKLPDIPPLLKLSIVGRTLLVQCGIFVALVFVFWGAQRLYAVVDATRFPEPCAMPAEAVVKGGKLISFRRRESDSELIDNILSHTESCDTAL